MLTFLPQHFTQNLCTLCVSSLHKQLQQIPIGSSKPLLALPPPQCLSPVQTDISYPPHMQRVPPDSPLQWRVAKVHGLDVMDVHLSQAQVSAQPLLPVQHVVCYLTEVHPVQLQLQVRAGTGREGLHIARNSYQRKSDIIFQDFTKLG